MTTSANWHRPPVGIVRVERALAHHLRLIMGEENLRYCIWQDGEFVEWIPSDNEISPSISDAIDVILPKTATFDLARRYLAKAFKTFARIRNDPAAAKGIDISIPTASAPPLKPLSGDFVISVGLDWDNQYTEKFFFLAKQQGLKFITCCYDLIPVLFPQYCVGEVAQKFTEYFTQLSWGSAAVLCISKQTQKDYLQLCEDLGAPARKTVVIPLGDNIASPTKSKIGEQITKLTSTPFILFVSTIERRKNHETLYRAYHILARRNKIQDIPKIIFVGMPGWGVGDLLKDIEFDPLTSGKIVQLNHVSDAELSHLYKTAQFCVYPSLYEGWGLPIGEALAMGKAVIASSEGSIPEVGGSLVKYVPAWDPYAWADAILDYSSNPKLVEGIEAKVKDEYIIRNWEDTARIVRDLIGELKQESKTSLHLAPGYDLSTLCGVHVGSTIRTTGKGGILLFGPHVAVNAGRYRLNAVGHFQFGHNGEVVFEIISTRGNKTHGRKILHADNPSDGTPAVVEIEFFLDKSVSDLEIRCSVGDRASLCLEQVVLTAEDAPQQGNNGISLPALARSH